MITYLSRNVFRIKENTKKSKKSCQDSILYFWEQSESNFILIHFMTIKKLLLGTTWIGILAGAIHLAQEEPKHEPVKHLKDATVVRIEEMISPFWPIEKDWIQHKLTGIIGNTIDSVDDFLSKNPSFKQIIQSMSWYREYLAWRLSQELAQQYISDAFAIEQILTTNPWLLQKMQYEWWWQRYTRGETNPTDMLTGNMVSLTYLQDFEKKNPELYAKIQQNPLWNKWSQSYEDNYTLGWQKDLVISASIRAKQLDTEPWLRGELARLWFSQESLFIDDGKGWWNIYNSADLVRQILWLDSGRKEWFYNTEIGRQYLAWTVDWIQLEQFLER